GEIAMDAGRAAEAEELFRRSLTEHPEFVAPALQLATLMLARGASPAEVEAAIPAGRPSATVLAATACLEAGHAEAAERLFAAALARRPAHAPALAGRVEALLSQRRFAEAAAAAVAPPGSPAAPMLAARRLFALAAAGDGPGIAAALAGARRDGVDEAD